MMLGLALCLASATLHADPEYDFYRAVQMDDANTVRALMAGGMDPNGQNPIGGETALILALREGSERVFQILLAHPAIRLEATALNGNTALMMAAYKHNLAAAKALLARGAQVNRSGWTALHYAAASGDAAIARLLLAHHAAIDSLAPGDLTPLMLAAREGQEATAAVLLELGADARLKSGEALTAEAIATRADKPFIADLIRRHLPSRSREGGNPY